MNQHKLVSLCLILFFALYCLSTKAETHVKEFGDISVYYSVVNTSFLTPQVAKDYGINRAGNLGLVNIAIRNTQANKPLSAEVDGNAYNLAGQNKSLAFKEVKEEGAIYYLATVRFSNMENLSFELNVRIDGTQEVLPIRFKQTMYVD